MSQTTSSPGVPRACWEGGAAAGSCLLPATAPWLELQADCAWTVLGQVQCGARPLLGRGFHSLAGCWGPQAGCERPCPPAAACTPTSCSATATWPGSRNGCGSGRPSGSSPSARAPLACAASTWPRSRRASSAAQVGAGPLGLSTTHHLPPAASPSVPPFLPVTTTLTSGTFITSCPPPPPSRPPTISFFTISRSHLPPVSSHRLLSLPITPCLYLSPPLSTISPCCPSIVSCPHP